MEWLRRPGSVPDGAVVFTSLPDASEVRESAQTLGEWEAWFVDAAKRVLQALPPRGVAVFWQTDIRLPGLGQVSKAFMILRAAAEVEGIALRWHKVAHFGTTDQPAAGSVKFTHILCFWRNGGADAGGGDTDGASAAPSRGDKGDVRIDLGGMIPDVLYRGDQPQHLKNSARCMGANASLAVLKWVARWLPGVDTVVDPFCGVGTALAIGNALGLHAIGVDLSPRRVRQARELDGVDLLNRTKLEESPAR